MSWQASAWAQRCHVGNGTAKAVLLYLADKAQPDGTGARPKIDTICEVVEFKRRAVINALRLLESRGFIRRGDQRLARLLPNGRVRPEQYAQVVWDLAVDQDPEVVSFIDRVGENDQDPVDDRTVLDGPDPVDDASGPDGKEDAESSGALNAPLETAGQTCTRCTSRGALDARPEVHQMHLSYKEQPSDEPPEGTNNPSAPTGHLPAAGGATPEDGSGEAGMADVDGPDAVGLVLDGLAGRRRALGLSAGTPSKADRTAVSRLLERLRGQGSPDPSRVVLSVLDTAFAGGWWPRLIRDGRGLAARWDRLVDDATLDRLLGEGRGIQTGANGREDASHVHSASCGHVLGLVDSPAMRAVEPDGPHRREACDRVAVWLNDGLDPDQTAGRLKDLLEDSRRRRMEDARRLVETRRANGGRMFAGARNRGDA